jgi:hypothetical protein
MLDEGAFVEYDSPTVERTYIIEWRCAEVCPPCTVPCVLMDRPWCPLYRGPKWEVTIW